MCYLLEPVHQQSGIFDFGENENCVFFPLEIHMFERTVDIGLEIYEFLIFGCVVQAR